ncbi:transposase family protein [Synechococcus sp. RedBA-s]|nr:transposase family protein [Synechococcus sp. RedBA-s]
MAQPAATADLIAFLQSLPEGRKRRGVRYPQWLLLLMAILGILSGCRSARDLERFAKRHRQAFSTALGLELQNAPPAIRPSYTCLRGSSWSSCSRCSRAGCWPRTQIRTRSLINLFVMERRCGALPARAMEPMVPRDLLPRSRSTPGSWAWRSPRPPLIPASPTSVLPSKRY